MQQEALDILYRCYLSLVTTVDGIGSQRNNFFNVRLHISVPFSSIEDFSSSLVYIITLLKTYGLKYDVNCLLKLIVFYNAVFTCLEHYCVFIFYLFNFHGHNLESILKGSKNSSKPKN